MMYSSFIFWLFNIKYIFQYISWHWNWNDFWESCFLVRFLFGIEPYVPYVTKTTSLISSAIALFLNGVLFFILNIFLIYIFFKGLFLTRSKKKYEGEWDKYLNMLETLSVKK